MADRIQDLRASISEAVAQQHLPDATRMYLELRSIDPNQVLSKQTQLDIANQLFSDALYPAEADAYELFLRNYPTADRDENVHIIMEIVSARYLICSVRATAMLSL